MSLFKNIMENYKNNLINRNCNKAEFYPIVSYENADVHKV